MLRGLLLTGVTPAFLRSDGVNETSASFDALWWPPTKVAGRYLGPYLADLHPVGEPADLKDRPIPGDLQRAAEDRRELRRLAIEMANADAGWGDFRSALHWLQAVEWLDGALTENLAQLRQRWQAAV